MPAPDLKTIGGRIKARRLELELTQVQLSKKAGIGQPAISAIEGGDTQWLRGPNLLRLANALDVDPGWIAGSTSTMRAPYPFETPSALIDIWSALDQDNRRRLINLAQSLLADQTGMPWGGSPPTDKRAPAPGPSREDPFPFASVPPLRAVKKPAAKLQKGKKTTP